MTENPEGSATPGALRAVTTMPALDPRSPVVASALRDALFSETRLLNDLIAIMRQQRDAASRDDLPAMGDSVFATQRVLHTLAEARRRRHVIYRTLGAPEDDGVPAIATTLGPALTPELTHALDTLMTTASVLAREVAVNRTALREALAAG